MVPTVKDPNTNAKIVKGTITEKINLAFFDFW